MNGKQKGILIWSAIIIVLITLFPPFLYLTPWEEAYTEYDFLFAATDASQIYIPFVLIEYLGVIIVAGLLVWAFKEKSK